MDIVTVWKRKRPKGWGNWRAYDLGSDAYGTWVFTPAHSIFTSDDEVGNPGSCESAQDSQGRGRHAVVLLPTDAWYVAHWVLDAEHVVSVDISIPPTRNGLHWEFQDLELDPFLLQDGTFGVEDEDEFEDACTAGLITEDERAAAERAVDDLRIEFSSPDSTLVEAGRRRLADAVLLGIAPLINSGEFA